MLACFSIESRALLFFKRSLKIVRLVGLTVVLSACEEVSSTYAYAASACRYSLSTSSATMPAGGGDASFGLKTGRACAWQVSADQSWVSILSAASGSASTTIRYRVAANTAAQRSANITVAGKVFRVTQSAGTVTTPTCTYAISPASYSAPYTVSSSSITVSAGSGCSWTASSSQAWVSISSGSSGSGNGSVSISVAANSATSTRSATLTIAGKTFTVNQAAAPAPECTYAISPASYAAPYTASSSTIAVTAGTGCAWTATSSQPWVSISSGSSGSGNGNVAISVAANSATSTRSATLTIAGRTFTVNQAAAPAPECTYAISPASYAAPYTASSSTIAVTAGSGCTWTATSNQSWVSISSGSSGSGNGNVAISVAANSATSTRSATLTIAGRSFTVNQAAAPTTACTYSVSPTNVNAPYTESMLSFAVSAGAGCAWTATSTQAWAAVQTGASGSGNGTVSVKVYANQNTTDRGTLLTIAGQSVFVKQDPAPVACSYALSLVQFNTTYEEKNNSVDVTVATGCPWTAVSNVDWIRITSGSSGNGNGKISYTVSKNSVIDKRQGSLTIAGKAHYVAQAGIPSSLLAKTTWSHKLGATETSTTTKSAYRMDMATDSDGNIYSVGYFNGSIAEGSVSISSVGASDIFLSKHNKDGDLLWIRTFGSINSESPQGIAIDSRGNIYFSAYFEGTLKLDNQTVSSAGGQDVLLATVNSSGLCISARRFGGTGSDQAGALSIAQNGDVETLVMTGRYNGSTNFEGRALTSAGGMDAFLMSADITGGAFNINWVKSFGGAGSDRMADIMLDNSGNTWGLLDFSVSINLEGQSIASTGNSDTLLLKYSPSGTLLLKRHYTGIGNEAGQALALAPDGRIGVSINFSEKFTISSSVVLTNTGSQDALVLVMDANANILWHVQDENGMNMANVFTALEFAPDNSLYFAGNAVNVPILNGNYYTESSGSYDVFAAKLSLDGKVVWVRQFNSGMSERVLASTIDGYGDLVLGGYFEDKLVLDDVTHTSLGKDEAFILKFAD